MALQNTDRLNLVRDFPTLIEYLRDELDWPIEDIEKTDDLTFDYEPKELGLDAEAAVKVRSVKQLRPLTEAQPWGIFYIEFEPKRLPIVVLRRILRSLVIKQRQVAGRANQPTWRLHDLLFISSSGSADERNMTFAHFSDEPGGSNLPTLRVLGWDDQNTLLRLDHVHRTLRDRLRWPDDESDTSSWLSSWSAAFTLRPREVIRTSKVLAVRLAELARVIRGRATEVLYLESRHGALRQLHSAFREALIHDLTDDDFADMYAQTVAYGLLTARVSRPAGLVADNLADMVPVTNPFLKEMLSTFLTMGGRDSGIDFDELGVSDVVELLRRADMEAVLRDFGNRNPLEDPVIHFYEDFLKEYDPDKRMKRGVFYTPLPVVSFIVRSVDELLQTEFGLKNGLADTTTWEEMAKLHKDLVIPDGISSDQPFVQIIDPATGTGTFLVEVIGLIHQTMIEKWNIEGHMELEVPELWNEYVREHLLPRLHGYEIQMAPYAIAHMKIGLKLYETGYQFGTDERARVYLTNALEPPSNSQLRMDVLPALAHEAQAANEIKRNQRFTVVIGNPPYSKASQNLGSQYLDLIEPFRAFAGERIREPGAILFERDINNDYVKFIGLGNKLIERTGAGIFGMITSNSYLDGKNFRGVRDALAKGFTKLAVLNLHGDRRSGALARQIQEDQNVFDIDTGVGILLATLRADASSCDELMHAEIVGTFEQKKALLFGPLADLRGVPVTIDTRRYKSFIPSQSTNLDEYEEFSRLDEMYEVAVDGIKTSRDGLVIANTAAECAAKIQAFMSFQGSAEDFRSKFGISIAKWDYAEAQQYLRQTFSKDRIFKLAYRPFDFRYIYYDPKLVFSDRKAKMSHLIRGDNLALVCASRLSAKGFNHILPADCLVEMKYASHDTNSRVFPLLLYEKLLLSLEAQPNIATVPVEIIVERSSSSDWSRLNEATLAVLNSEIYRTRFFEEIKNDFPRIPPLTQTGLIEKLAKLGRRLIRAQLLKNAPPEAAYRLIGTLGEEIRTPKLNGNRLQITGSAYFADVQPEIFEFTIAGYQTCKVWISAGNKSHIQRKGEVLTRSLANEYRRVLSAIAEIIEVRVLIDKAVSESLGW